MTAKTPFLFADLVENRASEACESIQRVSPNSRSGTATQHSQSMEFKSLDLDPQSHSKPDCLYTEDDLARAVDDAKRATALETEAAVRSVLADDMEQRRCDMLAAIKNQLERHVSAFEAELARLAAISHGLAVALAKAVIPRAIEHQPLVDIADILKATMAGLAAVPAIELRLHPSLVESGGVLMAGLAEDAGFAGDVTTVPDPALGEGDAELRWRSGMASRRLDLLQDEALKLAGRWLQQCPETDHTGDCTSCSTLSDVENVNVLSDQANDMGSTNERAIR